MRDRVAYVASFAVLCVMALIVTPVHGVPTFSGKLLVTASLPTITETIANYSLNITLAVNRRVLTLRIEFSNVANAASALLPAGPVSPTFTDATSTQFTFLLKLSSFANVNANTLRQALSSVWVAATTENTGITRLVSGSIAMTGERYQVTYDASVSGGQSWADSVKSCIRLGLVLASPVTLYEWNAVYDFLQIGALPKWFGAHGNNTANPTLFCWEALPGFRSALCPTAATTTSVTVAQVANSDGDVTCYIASYAQASRFCGNMSFSAGWRATGVNYALYYSHDLIPAAITAQSDDSMAYPMCSGWKTATPFNSVYTKGIILNVRTPTPSRSRSKTESMSGQRSASRTSSTTESRSVASRTESAVRSQTRSLSNDTTPSPSNVLSESFTVTASNNRSSPTTSVTATDSDDDTVSRTRTPPPTRTPTKTATVKIPHTSTRTTRSASLPQTLSDSKSPSDTVNRTSNTMSPTGSDSIQASDTVNRTSNTVSPTGSDSIRASDTANVTGTATLWPTASRTPPPSDSSTKSKGTVSMSETGGSMSPPGTRSSSDRVSLTASLLPTRTVTLRATGTASSTAELTHTAELPYSGYELRNGTVPYEDAEGYLGSAIRVTRQLATVPYSRVLSVRATSVPFRTSSLGVWGVGEALAAPASVRCTVVEVTPGSSASLRAWVADNVTVLLTGSNSGPQATLPPVIPIDQQKESPLSMTPEASIYFPPFSAQQRRDFFGADPGESYSIINPRPVLRMLLQLTPACSAKLLPPATAPFEVTMDPPPTGLPDAVRKAMDLRKIVGPTVATVGSVVSGASTAAQISRTTFVLGLYACTPNVDTLDWVQNPFQTPVGGNFAAYYTGAALFNPIFIGVVAAVQTAAAYGISVLDDKAMQTAWALVKFPSYHAFLLLLLMDATVSSCVVSIAYGTGFQVAIGVLSICVVVGAATFVTVQLFRTFAGSFVPNDLMQAHNKFHRFLFGERWWVDTCDVGLEDRYRCLISRYESIQDVALLKLIRAKELAGWREKRRAIDGAFTRLSVTATLDEDATASTTVDASPLGDNAREGDDAGLLVASAENVRDEMEQRRVVLATHLPQARCTPGFCGRNKMFFNEYNDRIPYFYAADLWVTAMNGLLDGMKLGVGRCAWVGFSYVVLFTAYLIAILVLRPHVCVYVMIFAVVQTLLQLGAAFAFCLGMWTDNPVFFDLSAMLVQVGLYLMFFGLIVDSLKLARKHMLRFLWRKKLEAENMLREAWGKPVEDSPAPEVSAPLLDSESEESLEPVEMVPLPLVEETPDAWNVALAQQAGVAVNGATDDGLLLTEIPDARPVRPPASDGLQVLLVASAHAAAGSPEKFARRRQQDEDLIAKVLAAPTASQAQAAIDIAML